MRIIWIDDKPEEMQNVIAYVIASLWQSGILSKIYIMRDTPNYERTIDQNIATLNDLIVGTFTDFLIDNGLMGDSANDELYRLIYEPDTHQDKSAHGDNDTSKELFLPTSNVMINKIKDFENLYSLFYTNRNEITEDYLKSFFNYKDEKPIIMIDMCLYSKDFDKLDTKSGEVIFSMHLYHLLKSKGYRTYMYTSYLYPNNLIEYWQQIYEKEFGSDEEMIKFFGRDGNCVNDQGKTLAKELGVENHD